MINLQLLGFPSIFSGTLWLLNVANWTLTFKKKIGKSSHKWAIYTMYPLVN